MKMKILVVPFVITVAIIFIVWLIYPAYSNGVDGLKENYTKLKSEQEKLNEIRGKNKNIASLSSQILALPQKDILYSFIPQKPKEEDIINSLGRLASESGLLLFDATVEQPEEAKPSPVALDSVNQESEEMSQPKIKNLSTEMKLVGSYEAIRNFLGKLGGFSRSNEIYNLEINKNILGDREEEAVSGSGGLIVSALANFNFLSEAELNERSVLNNVFASSKLDTKIIDNIKEKRSVSGYQLEVGQKGRANLFQ